MDFLVVADGFGCQPLAVASWNSADRKRTVPPSWRGLPMTVLKGNDFASTRGHAWMFSSHGEHIA